MNDVLYVLGRGQVKREPEPHIKTGFFVYRMSGRTIDGEPLVVAVAIMSETRIDVVTVIDRED